VDDVAGVLREQHRKHRLRHVDRAHQVHLHHQRLVLRRAVAERGGAHQAGAVEEGVDPPEALHGGAHHRAARFEVAHVEGQGGDVAGARGELGLHAREARAIAVGQREPHSLARQASGERTAKAAGRARHERHASLPELHVEVLRRPRDV
jgi:hypothetical protein